MKHNIYKSFFVLTVLGLVNFAACAKSKGTKTVSAEQQRVAAEPAVNP